MKAKAPRKIICLPEISKAFEAVEPSQGKPTHAFFLKATVSELNSLDMKS